MAEEIEKKQDGEESPKETQSANDGADIVLDDTQTENISESEKAVDFQKMTPAQKKKHIQELKEKKAKEKKAKEKAEKEASKVKKDEPSENGSQGDNSASKKGGSGKIILIIILVVLIVGGAVAYLLKKKHSMHKTTNEKVVVVAPASDTVATEETAQAVTAETTEKAQEPTKAESKGKNTLDKKAEGTKATTKPTAKSTATAKPQGGTLQRPCWLISVISVTNEKHAQKGVTDLQAKGITGGYYWIPDYVPNGNQYFKVYAGPYTSKNEAIQSLASIQEINQQAYVLQLK